MLNIPCINTYSTGIRLNVAAMETYCVTQSVECLLKCTSNSSCLSFGIGDVDNCPGQVQCLLYSQVNTNNTYHVNDLKYTYFIMVSSSYFINYLDGNLAFVT